MEQLLKIQQELNAPKNQYNSFGKYKYRSCEDILAAVKPILKEVQCTLTLSDEVIVVANRVYVKATATLNSVTDGKSVSTTASAREDETKKGMDGSQITGTASSYARKYALNGLFAIDDTKDADATNKHGKDEQPPQQVGNVAFTGAQLQQAIAEMNGTTTNEQFQACWQKWATSVPALCQNNTEFYKVACQKSQQLKNGAQ